MPVRHWVLSLPYQLRYLLAWDHDLCRAVAGLLARAVCRVLRERARDESVEGGRGGAAVVLQRFGGALNLNVHLQEPEHRTSPRHRSDGHRHETYPPDRCPGQDCFAAGPGSRITRRNNYSEERADDS